MFSLNLKFFYRTLKILERFIYNLNLYITIVLLSRDGGIFCKSISYRTLKILQKIFILEKICYNYLLTIYGRDNCPSVLADILKKFVKTTFSYRMYNITQKNIFKRKHFSTEIWDISNTIRRYRRQVLQA